MPSRFPGASDRDAPRRHWRTAVALAVVSIAVLAACHDGATDPGVADLMVSVETSGGDVDTSGYSLLIDGRPVLPLDPDGVFTLSGVATGQHRLSLGGVDPNCAVDAPYPRDVVVRPGAPAVQFAVRCETTGISISVREDGEDPGPDGYAVTLDGGPALRIYPGATLIFNRLAPTGHTVTLDPSASNCAVQGERARLVVVRVGAVTAVEFDVACEPITGTIQVDVSTTGVDPDPDGYLVRIDGSEVDRLGIVGSTLIRKVPAGAHTIQLDDVNGNCAAVGGLSQPTDAIAGGLVTVSFTITCTTAEQVSFMRWVGYEANIMLGFVDGSGSAPLTRGTQAAWSPDGQQLVVRRDDCFYYYYCATFGLFLVGRNGAELRQLTSGEDTDPAWSPAGQRIAFVRHDLSGYHLFVVNADGTGATAFLIDGFHGRPSHPSWSPDGLRIVFTCGAGSSLSICLANADGTGFSILTSLSSPAYDPAWSPDGTQIALTLSGNVAVMNPDGSAVHVLATGDTPAWSPDGSRIVFRCSDAVRGICVINVDGTGLAVVSTDSGDMYPAWRP